MVLVAFSMIAMWGMFGFGLFCLLYVASSIHQLDNI
jgi:hypothetical protein